MNVAENLPRDSLRDYAKSLLILFLFTSKWRSTQILRRGEEGVNSSISLFLISHQRVN